MECNQNKKATVTARHPMVSYHAGAPMERVHLDFIGPLPRTEQGNEHILMMVDPLTKWFECIPLPSQSAEETARTAVNQFFSRLGCSFQLFTDQGRNFESALFRAMCDLLHIHKSITTPYRPSANGRVHGGEPSQEQEETSDRVQGSDEINKEGEEDEAVTVLKLSNGVMFTVPIEVQGMRLQVVVDTAAPVTLVSEEFYKSLDPAPPIHREVVMNTAGKGMQMNGFIANPFQVVLGTHQFSVDIYVAPIEEMLLGLDFLESNGVSLPLKERKLQISGEVIPMSWGAGSPLVSEKEIGMGVPSQGV